MFHVLFQSSVSFIYWNNNKHYSNVKESSRNNLPTEYEFDTIKSLQVFLPTVPYEAVRVEFLVPCISHTHSDFISKKKLMHILVEHLYTFVLRSDNIFPIKIKSKSDMTDTFLLLKYI